MTRLLCRYLWWLIPVAGLAIYNLDVEAWQGVEGCVVVMVGGWLGARWLP